MRNAGASIDPPTDPLSAVPASDPPKKHPVRSNASALPPGVSADIFGERPGPSAPGPSAAAQGSLPPPATPVELWPVIEKTIVEEPAPLEAGPEPKRRTLRYTVIGLVLLLLLAYLVPAISMSGRILPGTTVLGVDIGGQSVSDAALSLQEKLYTQTRSPVVVRQGTHRIPVDPIEAGLQFDAEATARQAPTGFPSPAQVVGSIFGGREIRPVVAVDQVKLEAAVAKEVGASLEDPVQEGGVKFKGTIPVPVYPHPGNGIDKTIVARDIQRAYLSPDVTVMAAAVKDDPQVDRAAVQDAVAWAKRAVAEPITLTIGAKSVQLPPAVLAGHLSFVPEGRSLKPRFEAAAAAVGFEHRLVADETAARNATFTIEDGKPVLVHARAGKRVDTGRLAVNVIEAMGGGSRTVPVTLVTAPPVVTDADVLKMGVKEKISEFTTSYACCQPRVADIQAAARLLDTHLVRPGETFSFNEYVGRRDAVGGFSGVAMVTAIRGETGSDVAGMSQVATTMLNAVVRAGLGGIERTAPDVYLPQYPAGLDAAVSYPGPDLKWTNDSPYGVLIQASASDTALVVSLWSTKRYDVEVRDPVKTRFLHLAPVEGSGPDCVPAPEQPGFTAEVTRVLKRDGKAEDRQSFTTVYHPQSAVTCPAPPA
ncbi:VanW family protein [Planotetraspora kaengkrachanensis]|uniref:Vanomycin resistance protein VanB n=1 Tax=Planotetraspora kaengkrachanensis TaxID=575193 RepID=A0A8J3PVT3_9ACTN|nr:VanW family protein [Planotetraspora kaengkrachanensis]GIG81992.1 vanomycin resistance protein VanB [Planotetraspora kaengkrachanensis]